MVVSCQVVTKVERSKFWLVYRSVRVSMRIFNFIDRFAQHQHAWLKFTRKRQGINLRHPPPPPPNVPRPPVTFQKCVF